MDLAGEWRELLRRDGAGYARVALAAIRREFPAAVCHTMTRPGDFPHRPRARTPAFYGGYDWGTCVSMHWLLLRLLRAVPGVVPEAQIRSALDAQFSPVALAAEAEFVSGPGGLWQGPHGWGWALLLACEACSWADPDGRKWAAALRPLADAVTTRLLEWLPRAARPERHGGPGNSAFALMLALPYARLLAGAGDPGLLATAGARAQEWFGGDTLYPGAWEPSGNDLVSPALAEAALMAQILPAGEFPGWLAVFLPGIAGGEPATLFTPVAAPEPEDPGTARPHRLNASRAWCWRRIAEALPASDPRTAPAAAAARTHAAAVLPQAASDEHPAARWVAGDAVLLLSEGAPVSQAARASGW